MLVAHGPASVLGPLVVTNLLWFSAIDRVGPSHAAVFANLQPFLAAGDATGDATWYARALRIAERLIGRFARESGWRVIEHFDERWTPLPDYNRDDLIFTKEMLLAEPLERTPLRTADE